MDLGKNRCTEMNSMDNKTNEIILFEISDGVIKLSVPVIDETVWLNRNQMADLFGRDVKP